eukprot:TRINITY_DN17876_c0_g1_i1.p4 TRINITY_DN17876_c0_g1~~TRINITY_DN17876_c0_g1_i1.p4  ORF type:complete len:103 (-),score=7.59 TRINITY_DN17876_c0_g1_i1:2-310(-)
MTNHRLYWPLAQLRRSTSHTLRSGATKLWMYWARKRSSSSAGSPHQDSIGIAFWGLSAKVDGVSSTTTVRSASHPGNRPASIALRKSFRVVQPPPHCTVQCS